MRVTVALSMLCIATVASCQPGLNWAPVGPPVRVAQVLAPIEITSGETGTFRVDFEGHSAPFTVAYDFDGGVVNTQVVHTVGSSSEGQYEYSDSVEVTFDGAASKAITKMLSVRITNASGYTATASTNFTVPASVELRQPSISHLGITDSTPLPGAPTTQMLTVDLQGTPGLAATVLVEGPPYVPVEPSGRNVNFDAEGLASVQFAVQPMNLFGAPPTLTVSVDGPLPVGGHDEESLTLATAPFQPKDDTLYAIPLQHTVRVGEPVRIAVITGPTAQPFFSANVTLCAPHDIGYWYEYSSLNGGTPGGEDVSADGIWEHTGATELFGSFGFWAEEGLLSPSYSDEFVYGWSFLLEPINGAVLPRGASGMILNFEATFDATGTFPLSFASGIDVYGFSRTAYRSDAIGEIGVEDYFWSDLTNNHPGVPNSVTVIP